MVNTNLIYEYTEYYIEFKPEIWLEVWKPRRYVNTTFRIDGKLVRRDGQSVLCVYVSVYVCALVSW